MRPLVSEFSFGYALTEEMASGRFGTLNGAPIFPSLYSEGKTGGGYDLKLPFTGIPIFLQFKLSHYLKTRKAKEWNLYGQPYYRMHLRPLKYSDQHNLLLDLEKSGKLVFYVAPIFYTSNELNQYYSTNTVSSNSIFFKPSNIGPLPDHNEHYVAFSSSSSFGYLCSEEPKKIKATLKTDFISGILKLPNEDFKSIDSEFFRSLSNSIQKYLIEKLNLREDIVLIKEKFLEKNISDLISEATILTYLTRTYFNAEVIIISKKNSNIEYNA